MSLPLPAAYHPELTVDRLQRVADWLLEEFYATQDELTRSTDTPYTRGCTTFGRQRSRIIAEWKSKKHPWLSMEDCGNALVFNIGSVPCRFSNDDPDNPSKDAVLNTNHYQDSFALFAQADFPTRFCFVVDRGMDGIADPYVTLLGYSVEDVLLCRWSSGTVRAFRSEGASQPSAVEVPKAKLGPKQTDKPQESEGDQAANDDQSESR